MRLFIIFFVATIALAAGDNPCELNEEKIEKGFIAYKCALRPFGNGQRMWKPFGCKDRNSSKIIPFGKTTVSMVDMVAGFEEKCLIVKTETGKRVMFKTEACVAQTDDGPRRLKAGQKLTFSKTDAGIVYEITFICKKKIDGRLGYNYSFEE